MGTMVNENGQNLYSFFNTDQILDFLLSIGMRPFVELSFMPLTLSSGSDTVFHYRGNVTPPKDYTVWEALIHDLVQHWVDRYGLPEVSQWFFEIWNEPNLKAFWTGSQADYFKLYTHAVQGIKKVNDSLQVGGPATADNQWISDFLQYCIENKVPADFISTHHYPTDAFGKPGDDTIAQLAKSRRSVLREEVAATKSQAMGKPVYYTEWSTSSNPFDELHDLPYAAAFITKTVMEAQGYVLGYSYWTFSDIFEENYFPSDPFHGGFGLMTIYGIPKPAYRAYELLHRLGVSKLPVQGQHETVDVWIMEKDGNIQILVTNSALPRHPVKTEIVTILLHMERTIKTTYIERIDDTHANATQAWIDMGRPKTLLPDQVRTLEAASALFKEPMDIGIGDHSVSVDVSIPPQGVTFITLEIA